jgi:predicted permease
MLHIFMTAVNAVFPIVLLILTGYLLRQKNIIGEDFVKKGNALVFKVCLPALFFVNIYDIRELADLPWNTIVYCALGVVALFLLGFVVAVVTTQDDRRRGVLCQCCFRSNFNIIGISLAAQLGGEAAAAVSAVIATLVVPAFNIFAVIALSVFLKGEGGKRPSFKSMLLDIVKNPLILAAVAGVSCLAIRALQQKLLGSVVFALDRELKFVYSALGMLKALATPLALVVLGGQFKFSVVKGMFREIAVGTGFRLIAAPVLTIGVALLLERVGLVSCDPITMPAMLTLFGSPVAVTSAVMAAQMHNDEQLAAQLVVWSSIGSVVTIFAGVCLLMACGLIAV